MTGLFLAVILLAVEVLILRAILTPRTRPEASEPPSPLRRLSPTNPGTYAAASGMLDASSRSRPVRPAPRHW